MDMSDANKPGQMHKRGFKSQCKWAHGFGGAAKSKILLSSSPVIQGSICDGGNNRDGLSFHVAAVSMTPDTSVDCGFSFYYCSTVWQEG